jgi:hypothetical protein
VDQIRSQSAWSLVIPAGLARPHQRSDFGTLPAFWESAGATRRTPMKAPTDSSQEISGATSPAEAQAEKTGEIRYKRRKRHRRRRQNKNSAMFWGVCLAAVMLGLLVLLILELTKGAQHMLPPPVQAPEEAAPPPATSN